MIKKAFTMIELIFIVVVIGILAVVAILEFSATRDDAKTTAAISNLSSCIMDVSSYYTAQRNENVGASAACKQINDANGASTGCWRVDDTINGDGNITVSNLTSSETWCIVAQDLADKLDLNGTHKFGGSKIVRN